MSSIKFNPAKAKAAFPRNCFAPYWGNDVTANLLRVVPPYHGVRKLTLIRSTDKLVMACIFLLLGSLLIYTATPVSAGEKTTVGAKIDWHKYMQSAANASAVAMALANVDRCSKKLHIKETRDVNKSGGTLRLAISCYGNEDEEGSAILYFSLQPDGVIFFVKLEHAG